MKEQRANAPRARRLRRSPNTPIVTYALIAVTVAVYLLQWVPGLNITNRLLYAGVYSTPAAFEPWRLVTSLFVHSTGLFFHVLLNMFTLFVFGRILEEFLGRIRFLILYLISGVSGSVAVLLLTNPQQGVVGASGAIFGLIGAFLVIQRKTGGSTTQLLVLVGINLVIGFIPNLNISWQAHVGGLVGGALVGLIVLEAQKNHRKTLEVVLLAGLSVLLIAVGTWPALV